MRTSNSGKRITVVRLFGLLRIAAALALGIGANAAAVAATQAAAPDPYIGMHIHSADQGTAWPGVAFGAWRLWDAGVVWPHLEPSPGQWNFTRLDRYVAFAERFGIDVLLPFGLSPQWASARPSEPSSYSPGFAAEPRDINDWRNYVRTVAERYKGRVRNFEIWNEVNIPSFYSGSMEKLVELTCAAQQELKAVSPENRLVSPSMVGAGTEPAKFEAFLAAGGAKCIDVVGYHFYVPHREPEELAALVGRIRQVMARQSIVALPLWNTEAGWWIERGDGGPETGADPRWRRVMLAESASVVARTLIVGRSAGLDRYYWYAWDNAYMGLIVPTTGAMKPGAVAMGTLIGWMQGQRPTCTAETTRWICRLATRLGRERYLAWALPGNKAEFVARTNRQVLAVERLDGSRDESMASTPGAVVPLNTEPLLIEVGGA